LRRLIVEAPDSRRRELDEMAGGIVGVETATVWPFGPGYLIPMLLQPTTPIVEPVFLQCKTDVNAAISAVGRQLVGIFSLIWIENKQNRIIQAKESLSGRFEDEAIESQDSFVESPFLVEFVRIEAAFEYIR
jgi:hypothetical protein